MKKIIYLAIIVLSSCSVHASNNTPETKTVSYEDMDNTSTILGAWLANRGQGKPILIKQKDFPGLINAIENTILNSEDFKGQDSQKLFNNLLAKLKQYQKIQCDFMSY